LTARGNTPHAPGKDDYDYYRAALLAEGGVAR
jgi:hypothetical protein